MKDKSVNKGVSDKSSLGIYIRQFESAVVTALRVHYSLQKIIYFLSFQHFNKCYFIQIYTTSSDPDVQSEVLGLLVQLIKGHVNYGLVDSSQVFLGFVAKQVSFIEEGHARLVSDYSD